MIPLYGFLEGDTIGLLVLAYPTDTVRELAGKLTSAASVRVSEYGDLAVVVRGLTLDPQLTLEATGLTALDRFDVRRRSA